MQNFERAGGYAAIIQGLLLAVLFAMFVIVLPQQGFIPTDFGNYSKIVPVLGSFAVVNVIAVARSFVLLVIILALYERMRAGAPNAIRLAAAGAGLASTLLLAQGMLGITGWPILLQNPSAAPTAAVAFQAVSQSLLTASLLAEGIALALVGRAAMVTGSLSTPLSSVILFTGMVIALIFIVGFLIIPGLVLYTVTSLWLGFALLKPSPFQREASAAKA